MVLSIADPNSSDPNVTCCFTLVKDASWKKTFLDIRSMSLVVAGVIDGVMPSAVSLRSL